MDTTGTPSQGARIVVTGNPALPKDERAFNRFATRGLTPDLTILLSIDPANAAARSGEADRFEDEGERLQRAVLAAYEELADADPDRWRRIDADRPPDEVHVEVLAAVQAMRAVRA